MLSGKTLIFWRAVIVLVWFCSSVAVSDCRGADKLDAGKTKSKTISTAKHNSISKWLYSVFHKKKKPPTTGTIVGRVGESKKNEDRAGKGKSKIAVPSISIQPDAEISLYSPPINGKRRLLATTKKLDKHHCFKFKNVKPGDDYRIEVFNSFGAKSTYGSINGVSVIAGEKTDVGGIRIKPGWDVEDGR